MTELTDKLTILIRDELAETQVNKDNESEEYRTGKMEAYSKILSVITTELTKNYLKNGNKKLNESN